MTSAGVEASRDAGTTWALAASNTEFAGQPPAVSLGSDGTRWLVTESPRVLYRDTGGGFDEVARG